MKIFQLMDLFIQQINSQSFSKGIYIFNIQTDNGFKFVKKILKQ